MDKVKDTSNDQMSQASSLFDENTPRIALKSLFKKYDVDGNGYLDRAELYTLLRDDLGLNADQAEAYYHLLDKDGDGKISYRELEKWFLSGERFETISNKTRYQFLRKAIETFKKYDTDNSLSIDKEEFHKLYTDLGGKGKKKEKRAMKALDDDNDGKLSFQEFLSWLNWEALNNLKF